MRKINSGDNVIMLEDVDKAWLMIGRFVIPRNILFLIFNVMAYVIFYAPLNELLTLSLSYDELYSHIIIIPLVSGYFIFLKRKEIASEMGYSPPFGIILITGGLLLYMIAKMQGRYELNQNDHLSLTIFSFLVVWIGGLILCYGMQAVRKISFPVLFLIFMIPIPTLIIDNIILLLQIASTETAYAFFKITGVPILREGFIFHLPGLSIEVARECSGIRSSLSLLITSLMAGHLFLRTGSRKVLLALSIFPITIMKNGLRIVTLSLLGVYVDERILSSALHRRGGIPFFLFALIFLGSILWILRRSEKAGSE